MTDRARRRSRALPVYAVAASGFVVATGALGAQMANGHDPSLGAGPGATETASMAAAGRAKRPLVVRRVHKTVVVTRVLPARTATPVTGTPPPSGAPSTPPASVRVIAAAPEASAPAPAPAAPAPPPAAPVTKSS